jgi:hypothetical protein
LEFAAWSSLDFGEWILILPFLKLQIPNSKIQGKFKNQTSNQPADATGWSLLLGVSLDFGEWILILPFLKLQIPNSKIQGKFKSQTSNQPADATGWSLLLGVPWILVSGF